MSEAINNTNINDINDINANNPNFVRHDRCGKIMSEIIKVENPVYQTKAEIIKQYWDNQVIVSNMEHSPAGIQWVGGVVRYYSKTRGGFIDIIMEMDKDEKTYGRCEMIYIGKQFDTLGGLGL